MKRIYIRAATVLAVTLIAAFTASMATVGVDETLRGFGSALDGLLRAAAAIQEML